MDQYPLTVDDYPLMADGIVRAAADDFLPAGRYPDLGCMRRRMGD